MSKQRRKSTGQIAGQSAITTFIGAVQSKVDENVQFKVPFLPLTSPEEPTPAAFRADLPLYAHQQRSLYRMLQIESRDASVAKFNFGMLDYFSKGGCLADDIGMGKTATMLALIVSEPINVTLGGNLLVAPSHLLAQWELEVRKFVQPGAIDVVVGLRTYLSMDRTAISNRTLVLVGVDEAIASRAHYYDYHKLYPREIGPRGHAMAVDAAALVEYKAAATFVSKAYSGIVWVTPLHLPEKPWRRVVFEEVQDLVLPGREAQDCFIQLTRRCEHVWLITATPFPEAADSIYANNQLLGFKRLRLLPHDPAFDAIKRNLYLRNCAQVKQAAITDRIRVIETYVSVALHPRELLLYKIECLLALGKCSNRNSSSDNDDDILDISAESVAANDRNASIDKANRASETTTDVWRDAFDAARQSCVHVGISDRVLERERVRREGEALATIAPELVTAKPPAQVYKNEVYHLARQRAVVQMRKRDVETMERATRNTVAICQTIAHQVYSTIAECFADRDASGLSRYFSHTNGETNDGFRMLRSHYGTAGKMSSHNNSQYIDPTELILYSDDEIEHYLRKFWDTPAKLARLAAIMETTLTERCPRARVAVDEQLAALTECLTMKDNLEQTALAAEIPFYGSKITHLVEFLSRLRQIKVVIFTMWPAALRVIESALLANNISCAKFLSHQSSAVKSSQVLSFLHGSVEALLLNSLTSASGINLQVASHVLFIDPVGYSAAQASTLEQQAIGRVLRMGQVHREVAVVRFVAEQTMEATLYDEIHAATARAAAANDSFFDGNDATNAYVCDGFDAPLRRVVRMEIRGEQRNVVGSENESESGSESILNKAAAVDDEEIEIEGAMSLEEAIHRRIQAAAATGVVFDLTHDDDNDAADNETALQVQLAAAAAQDARNAQHRKRKRTLRSTEETGHDDEDEDEPTASDPYAIVRVKCERVAATAVAGGGQ